jgi:Fe-S cluster assembly protein SufD
MTVHTPRILTDGETALVSAYEAANFTNRKSARDVAIEALKANGLPTRRIEAFHYTDLRALLKGGFSAPHRPADTVSDAVGAAFPRLVKDAAVLQFCDGYYFDRNEALPDGVAVAAGFPETLVANSETEDAVAQINTAFGHSGATIAVRDNVSVSRTVGLACAVSGESESISALGFQLNVGKGASCRFIERAMANNGSRYLSSCVVNLDISEGATVDYVLSQEEGDAALRLARLNVNLGAGATLNLFILNAGGQLVRQEINFDVLGEGANLNISGVNLVGGSAHVDVTSRITHHVPNTTSTETFHNVATGRGRGVFQGQINVRQAAQLTDARMACKTLLLSDGSDFSAKPELEIFADDVQCAHGATVTDLEESYVFYLMARGIPEMRARRMLIKAFVAEIVEEMSDENLVDALEERIDVWMEEHV